MSLLEYWFKCIFCIPKQIINNINIFFETPLCTLLLLFIIHRREIYTKAKEKKVFFKCAPHIVSQKLLTDGNNFRKKILNQLNLSLNFDKANLLLLL